MAMSKRSGGEKQWYLDRARGVGDTAGASEPLGVAKTELGSSSPPEGKKGCTILRVFEVKKEISANS